MGGLCAFDRVLEHELCGFDGARATGFKLFGQQVTRDHQHRRPPAEYRHFAECFTRIEVLMGEPICELGQQIIQAQRAQREGIGLAEQRPLALVKELFAFIHGSQPAYTYAAASP